jgi:tRNA wybutosine-synthesizing protein 3
MSAGFRESGIHSITGSDPNPIVAIRTMGLAFSSIIAYATPSGEIRPMVPETYLRTLLQIANERFVVNTERTQRFRRALLGLDVKVKEGADGAWEPAEVRKERKRAEGLRRKQELESQRRTKGANEAENGPGDVEMLALPN